jgi:hypothetical protein
MANVPSYQPVEQLRGPVSSEESISVNPLAFGAGVGQATEKFGEIAEQAGYRAIERDNYIKVERARQNFMAAVDAKSQDLMTRRGEAAEGTPLDGSPAEHV